MSSAKGFSLSWISLAIFFFIFLLLELKGDGGSAAAPSGASGWVSGTFSTAATAVEKVSCWTFDQWISLVSNSWLTF